jgi:hypothetical protein
MLGMAIRMATDLNLHRKSMVSGLDTEEGRARDLEVSLRVELYMMLITRSSIARGHGCCASYWIGPSLLKWASHTLSVKTTLSETPARHRGIFSGSRYPPTELWRHMSSCSKSCRELSILSIRRRRQSLVCVMTVIVSPSDSASEYWLTGRYVDCSLGT